MERFARVVIGYHGCTTAFARRLLLDETAIEANEAITAILADS